MAGRWQAKDEAVTWTLLIWTAQAAFDLFAWVLLTWLLLTRSDRRRH